jgi:hypothetical protein
MLRKFLIPLCFLPVAVMLVIPNHFYYWDGVDVAWYLDNPNHPVMFHQHHLAYAPLCYAIYRLLHLAGINTGSLQMLIAINLIVGIIFLVICYRLLKQLFPNYPFAGAVGVLITGTSYIFGTYFRNSDPYIIPITILAFILLRITREIHKTGSFKVQVFDWILFFIAVLIHQMSLFMLPAIIYADLKSGSNKRRLQTLARILVLIIVLFVTYLSVYWIVKPNPSLLNFYYWVIGYAKKDFWVFSDTSGFVPIMKQSIYQSLLSNQALLIAPAERSSELRLPDFINPVLTTTPGMIAGWILFLTVIILGFYGMVRMIADQTMKKQGILMLIWIIPLFLFMQIFIPYQCFYRLFYLIPFLILIFNGALPLIRTRILKSILLALIILFITNNFIYGFIPESNPENNPWLSYSKAIKTSAPDNSFFIMPSGYYCYGKYMRYFTKTDSTWVNELDLKKYPDSNFEKIEMNCDATVDFLNRNYSHIFISRGEVAKSGYVVIFPLSIKEGAPYFLPLSKTQIYPVERVGFGDLYFDEIILKSIKTTE